MDAEKVHKWHYLHKSFRILVSLTLLVMGAEAAAEPLYCHSKVMEKVTLVALPVQLRKII